MEVKAGYKQTDVGVIPEDWAVVPFADIANIRKQKVNPQLEDDIFCIDLEHIARDSGRLLGYSDVPSDSTVKASFKKNDVLFGRLRAYLRKFWLAERDGVCSTEIWPIVAKPSVTTGQYLFQLIQTERFLDAAVIAYGTHMPRSDWNVVKKVLVVIPPPPEQRAIATAISDVDALITSLDKLIAKKRDIKQAAMQELLTGKRRLPGFSGEWTTTTLGELGNFFKGNGIKKDEVLSEGLPCIRYGEIYTCYDDYFRNFFSFISDDTAKGSQQIKKGDLLFAGSGETAEDIGKCVAYMGDDIAYAGGDVIILTPKTGDSMYLSYLINSPSVANEKAKMGQGEMIVHISGRNLAKLVVTLPSVTEQTAIATVLSDMDAELTALEQMRDKTKALKQGMMQELLTGRIRLV